MGAVIDHVDAAYARIEADDRPEVWIALVPRAAARQAAAAVEARVAAGAVLPLAGLTVGVKDNIDVAGLPTTAACPTYAGGPAVESAPSVLLLEAAGAVVIGKTNLDQFATGLVGTRSPYGAVRNAIDPRFVAGGSSSGSAVAVARGHVDLALGTDTAGSGRVPAAHNGIVGLKPTRGSVSSRGVVPACASFDCVSVFATTIDLAQRAFAVLDRLDPDDPARRPDPLRRRVAAPAAPVVGVPLPDQLGLPDDARACFDAAVDRARAHGATVVAVDLASFEAAGRMLYGGAFVAERYAAVGAFLEAGPEGLDPTVASIILAARDLPAWRLAADQHDLRVRATDVARLFTTIDVLLLPTVTSVPTLDEVAADPVGTNVASGRWTTPCNLVDLCALAVPAGVRADGLPFGVTLHAPAGHDRVLVALAAAWRDEALTPVPPEPVEGDLPLVVAGAHLRGQPLNHQLTDLGATYLATTTTASGYRLYALDTVPPKPGLVRVDLATDHGPDAGSGPPGPIEVEVWSLAPDAFARFVAAVPAPLAIGQVELADGSTCTGFTCMPDGLATATDITAHGGWRAYRAAIA